MSKANILGSGYFDELLYPTKRRKIVKQSIEILENYKFDTIAFSGISGALIGPIIAESMKKHILVVRKELSTHSSRKVYGNLDSKRYVIVDDFMQTGTTVDRITKAIKDQGCDSNCLGVLEVINMFSKRGGQSQNRGYKSLHHPVNFEKRGRKCTKPKYLKTQSTVSTTGLQPSKLVSPGSYSQNSIPIGYLAETSAQAEQYLRINLSKD